MSAQYFLDEMSKRWDWGNLTDVMVLTRSQDILADWRMITISEADDAVQLLRRREFHKGNFMPSADEIERAVHEARRHRNAGKPQPTNSYHPTKQIEFRQGMEQFVAEATGKAWRDACTAKCGSWEAYEKGPHNAALNEYLRKVVADAKVAATDLWHDQNRVAS